MPVLAFLRFLLFGCCARRIVRRSRTYRHIRENEIPCKQLGTGRRKRIRRRQAWLAERGAERKAIRLDLADRLIKNIFGRLFFGHF